MQGGRIAIRRLAAALLAVALTTAEGAPVARPESDSHIPEPATFVLIGFGLLIIGLIGSRKRRA